VAQVFDAVGFSLGVAWESKCNNWMKLLKGGYLF